MPAHAADTALCAAGASRVSGVEGRHQSRYRGRGAGVAWCEGSRCVAVTNRSG